MSPINPPVDWGVAASLAGIAYIQLVRSLDLFPAARYAGEVADPTMPLWLAAAAIFAALVFEEFIFRGLILSGVASRLSIQVC